MRVAHPVANQAPTSRTPAARRIATDTPENLLDYVIALCEPTIHLEAYQILIRNRDGSSTWITQRHRTSSPPLLEQLWSTVEASGSAESGVRSFASKPAARIDSIDAAMWIERDTHRWLTDLTDHDLAGTYDEWEDLIAAVRHLGSLGPARTCSRHRGWQHETTRRWCCLGHHLEHDVRAWWIQARVLTGWDSPAWKPDNSCPLCGVRGGLRVRLEARAATCVECREHWDPASIGLLADHIRAENHDVVDRVGEGGDNGGAGDPARDDSARRYTA